MKKIIYIVDDDEAVRTSTQFLLEISGFECRAYASATAFEAAFDAANAVCILADLKMPGKSGIDLVRHLRSQGIIVPAIIMTGHGGDSAMHDAEEAGVVGFLHKPFDSDVLFEMLGRTLPD